MASFYASLLYQTAPTERTDASQPALPRPEDEADPGAAAARRNQTTAVILCGVLGALFDLEQVLLVLMLLVVVLILGL